MTMTVQLEYINNLSKIFPIYVCIMLNAFSDLLCWHNRLVPILFVAVSLSKSTCTQTTPVNPAVALAINWGM